MISFSAAVKKELITANIADQPKHCNLAEIAALLAGSGQLRYAGVSISGENAALLSRFYNLTLHVFSRAPEVSAVLYKPPTGEQKPSRRIFSCTIAGTGNTVRVAASRLLDDNLLARECCKRAYIRGAFLSGGSLSNPSKHYHLEFVNQDMGAIVLLRGTAAHFGVDMRVTKRKSANVLYVKDGERIAYLLNIIGAHKSLMELENVRILKEVRNNINRQVNFETANLTKTVNAAVSQMADIKYILESGEYGLLSQSLTDVARLRLEYPSASLQEIGEKLSPAISKSAVNHRLRKISAIAEKLRGE